MFNTHTHTSTAQPFVFCLVQNGQEIREISLVKVVVKILFTCSRGGPLLAADTSQQQPISQTTWLKVTPYCNHCKEYVLCTDDGQPVGLKLPSPSPRWVERASCQIHSNVLILSSLPLEDPQPGCVLCHSAATSSKKNLVAKASGARSQPAAPCCRTPLGFIIVLTALLFSYASHTYF
jgi:hypothetical protein